MFTYYLWNKYCHFGDSKEKETINIYHGYGFSEENRRDYENDSLIPSWWLAL
jgi:hypothetical protein